MSSCFGEITDLTCVPRWVCFILGRQTSMSELGLDIPVPTDDKIMAALVKLMKIVSHCADRIYNQTYESLVHMWDVVNEIRGELREFANEQRKEIGLEPDRVSCTGELGFCLTIISASKYKASATIGK